MNLYKVMISYQNEDLYPVYIVANTMIEALESYKETHDYYPNKIEVIGLDILLSCEILGGNECPFKKQKQD